MKYSEFREYLKSNGFELIEDDVLMQVNTDGLGCVKIAKNTHRQIILPFAVEEPEQFELIRKALELAETPLDERVEEIRLIVDNQFEISKIELAETPLEEREEEKKYYLRFKCLDKYTNEKYINLALTGKVEIKDRREDPHYKTKFTKADIEELKVEFDTDLRDFELIEVEED